MARRRKSSLFEMLFELVAKLPWWGGAGLGVVSYLGLHHLATTPTAVGQVTSATDLASRLTPQLLQTLALFGQYIIPPICLLAAATSAWRHSKRYRLMEGVEASPSPRILNEMSWQEFEVLVAESFRRQGYSVQEKGGGGADGGVDLILTKGGEKFLVQCKQWKALTVGVAIVRELFGLMAACGATGAYVVTSGRYSQDARAFAAGRNIVLIDGETLKGMIDGRAFSVDGVNGDHRSSEAVAPLACPECNAPMVRRVARVGVNAGRAFYGCSRYPSCKGTR